MTEKCERCGGTGTVSVPAWQEERDGEGPADCPECGGSGSVVAGGADVVTIECERSVSILRRVIMATATIVLASACIGATATSTAPEPILEREQAALVYDKPLRVAVVGDSITAWNPPYAGDPAQSWVNTTVLATDVLRLTGGWARPGATIGEMLANVTPAHADVVVIMAGTNDLFAGTPVEDRLAGIDAIAATIGARYVILASTAPYGYDYAAGVTWNAILAAHAEERGWTYLDPWAGVRQDDGSWVPGADYGDLVHPSPATATYVGGVIQTSLLEERVR